MGIQRDMDRRPFRELSALAGILAARRAPAFAQGARLHIVRWNDFIPQEVGASEFPRIWVRDHGHVRQERPGRKARGRREVGRAGASQNLHPGGRTWTHPGRM